MVEFLGPIGIFLGIVFLAVILYCVAYIQGGKDKEQEIDNDPIKQSVIFAKGYKAGRDDTLAEKDNV